MDATTSTLKQAFGIDEVLLTIYGFLVGTDMNSNAQMMKLRLVSSRFNTLFLSYIRSIPLQLKYDMAYFGDDPTEGSIVRWLKRYDITTLFKLVVNVWEQHIRTFCEDFDGLDLSNLEVLDLSIYGTNPERDASYVENVFFSFAQAKSLTSLKLNHDTEVALPPTLAKAVYDTFLSYFPILNSLEVTLDDGDNISTTLEYPKKLEHLVQHQYGGNLVFRSESVKTWDLSSCQNLNLIISIDCPSLEKIICRTSIQNPVEIVGISTDTMVKQFGNTDKDYIADYLQSNTHYIKSWDMESIASISVLPMDYITGRNIPIKVTSDCVLVLFAFDY